MAAKTRADAVRFAYSHIGDHEDPPGSNHCVYSTWYDQGGKYGSDDDPWCLKFASFVIVGQCGVTLPGAQSPHGFASSILCLDAAKDHGKNPGVHGLQPGDFVIYHVAGEGRRGVPNHGGVFVRYCTEHEDCVVSVDGNTGHSTTASQRDGGCVDEKHRPLSWVLGGYAPDYSKPKPAPVPAHPKWWTHVTHLGEASQEVASALAVIANPAYPKQVTLDAHVAHFFAYVATKTGCTDRSGNLTAELASAIDKHWGHR